MAREPDKQTPGVPLWVKVCGLVALAAIVLLLVMLVAGGGDHGPQQHSSARLTQYLEVAASLSWGQV